VVSSVDGNWTQDRTDRNLAQDRRQDKEQRPLQKLALDEESETLVILQRYPEYDAHGMEYRIGQYRVPCSVHPSL